MKIFLPMILLFAVACASKPHPPICPEATTSVVLSKAEATKIQGNVSQFLTDAQITQEHNQEGAGSVWRFTNMPSDSVYYHLGLRDGDAITKTNLGAQTSSINLISDLSGLANGTTNCLYVEGSDKSLRVIKVMLEKK